MSSGWSQYAVMVRRCNDKIFGAALFGLDGTMWGQDGLTQHLKTTEDVARTKQEILNLIGALTAGEGTDQYNKVFQSGFKFLNREWACVRMEENNMIVGKGKAPNTAQFCGRKTSRCLVVACAKAEGANTNAIEGATKIGDFLEESGY